VGRFLRLDTAVGPKDVNEDHVIKAEPFPNGWVNVYVTDDPTPLLVSSESWERERDRLNAGREQ
jgi:hypothetical protein